MSNRARIEQIIADLVSSDDTVSSLKLIDLSDLNSEEAKLFARLWVELELGLRRRTINQMVELAEDRVELNFDSIFRRCLKDSDAQVRKKAIEGLWECEDASLINPLIELLEQDDSEEVRVAAAMALGNFALLAELEKINLRYVPPLLQALLNVVPDETKPIELRCHALEAAAPLSRREVTSAIEAAYHSDHSQLKASAIYAMGRNCNISWLPILIKESSSADTNMRCEAAEACGELGEKEVVPYLIEMVNDSDADVALTAIQALGKVGGNEAKKRLQQLLNEPEEIIRQVARAALSELEAEENPLFLGSETYDTR